LGATTTTENGPTTTMPPSTTVAPTTTVETEPTTVPQTPPTTGGACRPGWGYGDKNHCHSGPPGLAKGHGRHNEHPGKPHHG
jgi:hypothetical protein